MISETKQFSEGKESLQLQEQSPWSPVVLIPIALIWLITSLGLDDASDANFAEAPTWLVFAIFAFATHALLLLGRFQINKARKKLDVSKLGWPTDSLLIILSWFFGSFVLSIAASSRVFDADLLLVQLILLLVVLRFSKRLLKFQKQVSDLRSEQLQLKTQKELASQGLASVAETSEFRKTELVNDLRGIFAEGESVVSDKLWLLSETVVRPLSHMFSKEQVELSDTQNIVWRPSWSAISRELSQRAKLRPLLTGLSTALVFLGFSVQVGDQRNLTEPTGTTEGIQVVADTDSLLSFFIQLGFGVFISWLAVFLGKRFLESQKITARIPDTLTRFATALVLSSVIAFFFTLAMIDIIVPSQELLLVEAMPLVIGLTVFIFGLIGAASQSLRSFTASILKTIEEENNRLRWEAARLNQQIWQSRRRLGKMLHGPIRSILISAAILWKQKQENPPSLDSLIEYTTGQFNRLSKPIENPLQALDETIELWRENCQIELQVNQDELSEIAKDHVASELLSDLLCDAILNSVVHGEANKLDIEINREPDKLSVKVTDDGKLAEETTPGLGSSMLDENTLWWSLSDEQGMTVLRADIPFELPIS